VYAFALSTDMDALLWEILEEGDPDDIIEVLVKLSDPGVLPESVEVVAQIGNIISCRIRRGDIEKIRNERAVASMKAPRTLQVEPLFFEERSWDIENDNGHVADFRPRNLPYKGRGAVIGIADWGFDFTHPNFIGENGGTRFIAIWDQSADYDGENPYGYGAVYTQEMLNQALSTDAPFEYLGYHPGKSDIIHAGMHGTHVLDIAAGNGYTGPAGVAPEAELLAVHLATGKLRDLSGLGESSRVFDAIDFLDKVSGPKPMVINLSVGSHGDSHAGLSLIEQAIDYLSAVKNNRAIVQSCGNYFGAMVHCSGRINQGHTSLIEWLIHHKDKTPNELEIWYESEDEITVGLIAPDEIEVLKNMGIGRHKIYDENSNKIGRYYHRKYEPNTNLSQILLILSETAAPGRWTVLLQAKRIQSGRYEAWIERDIKGEHNQSRFPIHQASNEMTTGSICNSRHTISVGAYNSRRGEIAFFSSVGPTWDGRPTPFLVAPGVGILAAKSASAFQDRSEGDLAYKTGTSMATPYVTGAVALLFEENGGSMPISEIKDRLVSAAEKPKEITDANIQRYGFGIFNVNRLFKSPNYQDQEKVELSNIKNNKMDYMPSPQVSPEALMETYIEQYPELAGENLIEFYDSLPAEKQLDFNVGDMLVRRQYAHHEPVWFGVVEEIRDREAVLVTGKGRRALRLPVQDNWEIRRIPIKLRNDFNFDGSKKFQLNAEDGIELAFDDLLSEKERKNQSHSEPTHRLYNRQDNPDEGYSACSNSIYQPKKFVELNREDHGIGKYNINHYVGFFNTRSKINICHEIHRLYFDFGIIFSQKNKASAKREPYKFNGRDTIRFTVGGTHGNFFEKTSGLVHDDWVSMEFDSKYETFFARTLKRDWKEAYEYAMNPIPNSTDLITINQHHFLAGRRSWRIGYDYFNYEKLFYIETAAMERYSSAVVHLVADLADFRKTIDAIWTHLIVNFAKSKGFQLLPYYKPDAYESTFGGVLRRSEEHESFEKATSVSWFQEVMKRHPGLTAKPIK
jgi:subtilisin family serine protease